MLTCEINHDTRQVKWRNLETGKTTYIKRNEQAGLIVFHVAGQAYRADLLNKDYAHSRYVVCNYKKATKKEGRSEIIECDYLAPILEIPMRWRVPRRE